MEIKILNYRAENKEVLLAKFDVLIVYDEKRSETFRNLSWLTKDGKKWIKLPSVKINEVWFPVYERTPKLEKTLLPNILKVIEEFKNALYDLE